MALQAIGLTTTQALHLRLGSQCWVVTCGQAFAFGRHSSNDLVLNDPRVSRFHAVVDWDGGTPILYDCDSFNGTYVDGLRVHGQLVLEEGHLISLGPWDLTVELHDVPAIVESEEEEDYVLFTEDEGDDLMGVYATARELHRVLFGLEWAERTGTLEVDLGKVSGKLTLCLGSIVTAELGRLRGLSALERLMRTTRGRYHFAPRFELAENTIDVSVKAYLREGYWEATRRHTRRPAPPLPKRRVA